MADSNLVARVAELEFAVARLQAQTATSEPEDGRALVDRMVAKPEAFASLLLSVSARLPSESRRRVTEWLSTTLTQDSAPGERNALLGLAVAISSAAWGGR